MNSRLRQNNIKSFYFKEELERVEDLFITLSVLEIYNEQITDLSINPTIKFERSRLREVPTKEIAVTNVNHKIIESFKDGVEFYQSCLTNLMIKQTHMSLLSSRSNIMMHFQVFIKLKTQTQCNYL